MVDLSAPTALPGSVNETPGRGAARRATRPTAEPVVSDACYANARPADLGVPAQLSAQLQSYRVLPGHQGVEDFGGLRLAHNDGRVSPYQLGQ